MLKVNIFLIKRKTKTKTFLKIKPAKCLTFYCLSNIKTVDYDDGLILSEVAFMGLWLNFYWCLIFYFYFIFFEKSELCMLPRMFGWNLVLLENPCWHLVILLTYYSPNTSALKMVLFLLTILYY